MANISNLKPFNSTTAKVNGAKGGVASGKARREKKNIKECLQILLETGEYNGKCGAEALACEVMEQAIRGNIRAMIFIRDTVGEKPTDKMQLQELDPKIVAEVESLVNEMQSSYNDKH